MSKVPLPSAAGRQGRAVAAPTDDLRERVLDATVTCVARWGVSKTTLDDIARQAGCARATVYRVVPGGKAAVLDAAGIHEMARLLAELAEVLEGADTLEELLTSGISASTRALRDHDALRYLFDHEPGAIMAHLAFDALDPLLETAAGFAAPWLERWLPPAQAGEVGEWVTRLVVMYGLDADAGGPDLTDPDIARRFVHTYVMPALATEVDLTDSDLPGPTDSELTSPVSTYVSATTHRTE